MWDETTSSLTNLLVYAPSSLAYTGPGAGLTMIGSLIAVLCVVLLALVAPVFYMIRFCLLFLRRSGAGGSSSLLPPSTASPNSTGEPIVSSVKDIVQ